jgi:hypothetical protein
MSKVRKPTHRFARSLRHLSFGFRHFFPDPRRQPDPRPQIFAEELVGTGENFLNVIQKKS